ncbi:hypothetical protein IVA79_12430 [Bradyrhizobium sp. 138]|uniref:hypothetical protein n=1 Tax=Bradyrhizobium sp. 138 TaxID=2782615 RepID=UPI001FF80BDE|nr:hypothetical protein [Bradyrhizobium sp. 138]MCK1734745.1 hypothetical protein [Bradyrhizobium sp. 138]
MTTHPPEACFGEVAGSAAKIRRRRLGNEHLPSAFGLHDMPALRQADDRDLRQELPMRTLPRDRHRVRGRLEIPVAEDRADDR